VRGSAMAPTLRILNATMRAGDRLTALGARVRGADWVVGSSNRALTRLLFILTRANKLVATGEPRLRRLQYCQAITITSRHPRIKRFSVFLRFLAVF